MSSPIYIYNIFSHLHQILVVVKVFTTVKLRYHNESIVTIVLLSMATAVTTPSQVECTCPRVQNERRLTLDVTIITTL